MQLGDTGILATRRNGLRPGLVVTGFCDVDIRVSSPFEIGAAVSWTGKAAAVALEFILRQ